VRRLRRRLPLSPQIILHCEILFFASASSNNFDATNASVISAAGANESGLVTQM
jgi:hypothetical protein